MLPLLLSVSNSVKVGIKWLKTGNDVTKEEVERALMEIEYEKESDDNDAEDAIKK